MVKISVKHNMDDLMRGLDAIRKKQVPFAMSLGLNKTGSRIRDGLMTEMLTKLDRPTPFTMEAWQVVNSNKRNLTTFIKAKAIQAQYLYSQVYGGTESALHLVPGKNARLNQYGNLPRRASSGANVVTYGRNVYKKTKKKLTRIGHFSTSRSYKPLIRFDSVVGVEFDKWFVHEFETAFNKAMLTAR